jgi:hypothetical protein
MKCLNVRGIPLQLLVVGPVFASDDSGSHIDTTARIYS